MTNHPVEMFNYHIWANQTILGRIKEISPSVLNQEVNSSFLPSLMPLAISMRLIRCGIWF